MPSKTSSKTSNAGLSIPYDVFRNEVIKQKCEQDHLFFTRVFFKDRNNQKFLVNWHHQLISEDLDRVIKGEIENLVINLPPGGSKTEIAIINFIARGLAINPNARFLHISSGDDLALLNSQTARDIVQSDLYQQLWKMDIANDSKAKKRWNVMIDGKKAGGVYAVSLGGQITGFRAGHMADGFQGAILLDDILKADSIYSEAEVNAANRRLIGTVKSRKANPKTPTILIMQRLGMKDPAAFIQNNNLSGKWTFRIIPALIDDEYVSKLPKHIQDMIEPSERDNKGRFSYWSYKEPLDELLALETGAGNDAAGNKVSRFTFAAQYMQNPIAIGGNLIRSEWFPRVAMPPKIQYRIITADTAMKTKEHNDFSVFQCWGFGEDKKIYLLDQLRGKWEAPELKRRASEFWNKHNAMQGLGSLRKMYVEDKSSGTGLIQDLKLSERIPIEGLERNTDKLTRVMDAVPHIESGYVCLLQDLPFIHDFVAECESFSSDNTHAHDDQIDPLCDAIKILLAVRPKGFFAF